MKDPYKGKRRQTNPMPRVELPPTEGSVPDLAERSWDPNALTAETCPFCAGQGNVPRDVAAAYRASIGRTDEDEEVSG